MANFYFLQEKPKEGAAFLWKEEANHLFKVLRKKPSDRVSCRFENILYEAEILEISKDKVSLRVLSEKVLEDREDKVPIHLFLSIPRPQTMSDILPKINELGVTSLFPVITKHSFVQQKENFSLERYLRIVSESRKQCGRIDALKVFSPLFLKEIAGNTEIQEIFSCSQKILFFEKEKEKNFFSTILNKNLNKKEFSLFIGGEGGFSLEEVEFLKGLDFESYSLSENIFRVETAILTGVIGLKIKNL